MDAGTLPPDITPNHKAWNRARWFAETAVHLSSLLHGLALQHLRNDWDLANLTTFHNVDPPPPLVRFQCSSLDGLDSKRFLSVDAAQHVHAQYLDSVSDSAAKPHFHLLDKACETGTLGPEVGPLEFASLPCSTSPCIALIAMAQSALSVLFKSFLMFRFRLILRLSRKCPCEAKYISKYAKNYDCCTGCSWVACEQGWQVQVQPGRHLFAAWHN